MCLFNFPTMSKILRNFRNFVPSWISWTISVGRTTINRLKNCTKEMATNTTDSVTAAATPTNDRSSNTQVDTPIEGTQLIVMAQPAPSASPPEVLSVFECPVCLEHMLPPYLQCNNGHLVCGACRPKITRCPTCRGPPPRVRNLVLEKVADTLRFPCRYARKGCPSNMLHSEKAKHEELCAFRSKYSCPCPGASCKWQGLLEDVMPHLKKVHKSITTLHGENIVFLATDISLPGAVDWVMLQCCFDAHFMLILEKREKQQGQFVFFATVQLVGGRKLAKSYMCRLELATNRRRVLWESKPTSIRDGIARAIDQSNCLKFDSSTAELFADNGNLAINVTITSI